MPTTMATTTMRVNTPRASAAPPPTKSRPRATTHAGTIDRVVCGPCKVNAAQRRRRKRRRGGDDVGDEDVGDGGGWSNNAGGGGGGGGGGDDDDEYDDDGFDDDEDEDEFWSRDAFEPLDARSTELERVFTELDAHALFAWQTTSAMALVGCVQHVIDTVAEAWDGRVVRLA